MSYPHVDPHHIFGQDLIKVFGPKASRRHISTLTPQDKKQILDNLPEHVDTDDLGDRPSFFQVTNKILTICQQTGALNGVDLDWCNDLRNGALIRHDSAYVDVSMCYKNNNVQRGIWLRHLVKDILFEFNPTNVLSGLARKLSDGTVNLNNGQHRTIGCIIVGVRKVPVEHISSDLLSIDVDEYATDNLNTLASSEFDNYRIRVWRNKIRKAEGRTQLEPEDIKMEDIFEIHASKRSRFVEKGKGTDNLKPLECSGIGNMIKYYDTYGRDIYERALDINCTVWNKSPVSTANCWGLMEFLTVQRDQGGLGGPTIDWTIQQAISSRYSNPGRTGMHIDFKNLINKDPVFNALNLPEPKIIAAGIYKICSIMAPHVNWAPIMYKGVDMSTAYLGKLRIMPPARASFAATVQASVAAPTISQQVA